MSTHIGTNFKYRGKRFLDSRQGGTITKSDLLNWDFTEIPVPPGFELCLNGHSWYYYNPNVTIEGTGHWIPRLVSLDEIDPEGENRTDFSNRSFDADSLNNIIINIENKIGDIHNEEVDPNQGNILSDVEARLEILEGIHFPTELVNIKVGGHGNNETYEVGKEVQLDPVTFRIRKKDHDSDPNNRNYSISISPRTSYHDNKPGDWTYSIAQHHPDENGPTYYGTAKVSWKYKTYYGVVSVKPVTNQVLNCTNFTSAGWATNPASMSVKTFNCQDGAYPCILVPKSYYNSDNPPEVIVGGLPNSNTHIVDVELKLNNGRLDTYNYKAICLNTIQTGANIQIELRVK